ncbi:metallophosphoesterase family protein [Dethiobacter alkaliphilus]|uniref:Metallophosphoesterase n=1 Tax=Dethiobacter alkaliphilus AHT 1 TaxID=555088 RepID=C0GD31_DETAL|nr:metallophosphoesterase family protein [Dethiobacter alkaliphilus]EEG79116.1 metallophosphoesterase [Dethiobacter alkaliphilus AHT 1]
MKTFVISDVHGFFKELESLLDVIELDLRCDRLVMLGDYIDRGPDSYLVVQKIMELEQKFGKDHVVLLRGNHEQMAINYCEGTGSSFFYNGGDETIHDFHRNGDNLVNYLDFFKSLRTYFEDEHFIYVHAGIRSGVRLAEQRDHDLLWIREEFYLNPVAEEKPVIFGHTSSLFITGLSQPFVYQGRIGIDTGCYFGGCLSAVELVEGELKKVHQVRAEAA